MCQQDNKGMQNPIMKGGWGFNNIINNLEEMVGKTMEDMVVVITIGLCNHNPNQQQHKVFLLLIRNTFEEGLFGLELCM